jgi:hypothetical protein
MKKALMILIALIVLIVLGVSAYLMLTGPRMREQPHITTYEMALPMLTPGSMPVRPAWPPANERMAAMRNPLLPTPQNVSRGKTYYGYYCQFCHGSTGDGNGPVGQSYVPTPSDLRLQKARSYSDGQLLRAMLTGPGHDPVLQRVERPEHYWYLVLAVREMGGKGGVQSSKLKVQSSEFEVRSLKAVDGEPSGVVQPATSAIR